MHTQALLRLAQGVLRFAHPQLRLKQRLLSLQNGNRNLARWVVVDDYRGTLGSHSGESLPPEPSESPTTVGYLRLSGAFRFTSVGFRNTGEKNSRLGRTESESHQRRQRR